MCNSHWTRDKTDRRLIEKNKNLLLGFESKKNKEIKVFNN